MKLKQYKNKKVAIVTPMILYIAVLKKINKCSILIENVETSKNLEEVLESQPIKFVKNATIGMSDIKAVYLLEV